MLNKLEAIKEALKAVSERLDYIGFEMSAEEITDEIDKEFYELVGISREYQAYIEEEEYKERNKYNEEEDEDEEYYIEFYV